MFRQKSAIRRLLPHSIPLLRLLAFSHDLLALALCWAFAYWLRFNLTWPAGVTEQCWRLLPRVAVVYALVFLFFRLYRGVWRYASLRDLLRIIGAVALGGLVTTVLVFMSYTPGAQHVPRSVLILHPLLLVFVMGGSRFVYRLLKDWRQYGHLGHAGEWVLVVGAGNAGERLARELKTSPEWQVAAFLDDDASRYGQEIHGIKICGPIKDIAHWAEKLNIRHVIIAMPGAPRQVRRQAMERAVQAGLKVLTVPALEDLLSGRITVSRLRQISLEDLLKRDVVQLDETGILGMLEAQVVAVTGAGGSIGAELTRQIAHFRPRLLLLYEHSEFALFQIEQEFRHAFPDIPIHCIIGDVKDSKRLDQVFGRFHPDYVFHAAAYKHVPLMEDDNAWQAVQNNIAGTYAVALAAQRHEVRKMVFISTDKAVNPVNVMGCTKRIAEMLLSCLEGAENRSVTQFIIVRFGNVLGSNGSVIPTFQAQIEKGGPVTVTHPDIIRYFMLIPEAAQLVLQAALMGKGGEIFVLDMGDPVRIMDLARDMILLSGHGEAEIPIQITGLRSGEKLYEELLADDETSLPTPHAKLRIAKSVPPPSPAWRQELEAWLAGVIDDSAVIKADLQKFAPEYVSENRGLRTEDG
ncbi:MAG: polysaccharide biosynthesis protein [Zoogloeaceae bacterium]|jgi:FlaA1/EpsC-like NDP-sugar epimerase|nr:polysaccharide biosynthesis protein [Zoogloeaceae bacterium]